MKHKKYDEQLHKKWVQGTCIIWEVYVLYGSVRIICEEKKVSAELSWNQMSNKHVENRVKINNLTKNRTFWWILNVDLCTWLNIKSDMTSNWWKIPLIQFDQMSNFIGLTVLTVNQHHRWCCCCFFFLSPSLPFFRAKSLICRFEPVLFSRFLSRIKILLLKIIVRCAWCRDTTNT